MWIYRTPGIPDEYFDVAEDIVATKEEIRVLSISKMRVKEGDKVVDVGCGTGTVTVELAYMVRPTGVVYAIDKNPRAIELTMKNVSKFGVDRYVVPILGEAPQALEKIPGKVDSIFIGGTQGRIEEIIEVADSLLKSGGRIVANLVLLENLYAMINVLKKLGFRYEVLMVTLFKGDILGYGTFFRTRNPVFIVVGEKP